MSSKDDMKTDPACQQDSSTNSKIDTPNDLLHLQCEICRRVLAIIPEPTADRIGQRLGYLSNGAIIPGSGVADLFTMAAMLGLSPAAIADQVAKGKMPKLGLGRSILYSLSGLFKKRAANDTED